MTRTKLDEIITCLGLRSAPRYSLEEVSTILGVRIDQVRELIKKRHLKGFKGTTIRWTGVFHDDLAAFLSRANGGVA